MSGAKGHDVYNSLANRSKICVCVYVYVWQNVNELII